MNRPRIMEWEWTPRGWWPEPLPYADPSTRSLYEHVRKDGTIMIEVFRDGSVKFDRLNHFGETGRAFWEALAGVWSHTLDQVESHFDSLERSVHYRDVRLTHQQFRLGGYIKGRPRDYVQEGKVPPVLVYRAVVSDGAVQVVVENAGFSRSYSLADVEARVSGWQRDLAQVRAESGRRAEMSVRHAQAELEHWQQLLVEMQRLVTVP